MWFIEWLNKSICHSMIVFCVNKSWNGTYVLLVPLLHTHTMTFYLFIVEICQLIITVGFSTRVVNQKIIKAQEVSWSWSRRLFVEAALPLPWSVGWSGTPHRNLSSSDLNLSTVTSFMIHIQTGRRLKILALT